MGETIRQIEPKILSLSIEGFDGDCRREEGRFDRKWRSASQSSTSSSPSPSPSDEWTERSPSPLSSCSNASRIPFFCLHFARPVNLGREHLHETRRSSFSSSVRHRDGLTLLVDRERNCLSGKMIVVQSGRADEAEHVSLLVSSCVGDRLPVPMFRSPTTRRRRRTPPFVSIQRTLIESFQLWRTRRLHFDLREVERFNSLFCRRTTSRLGRSSNEASAGSFNGDWRERERLTPRSITDQGESDPRRTKRGENVLLILLSLSPLDFSFFH